MNGSDNLEMESMTETEGDVGVAMVDEEVGKKTVSLCCRRVWVCKLYVYVLYI